MVLRRSSRAFDPAFVSGVSRRPDDSIKNVSGHFNFVFLPCWLLIDNLF